MIEKPKWLLPSAAVLVLVLVILYALGLIGGGEKVEPGRTSVPAVEALPAGAETRVVSKNIAAYYAGSQQKYCGLHPVLAGYDTFPHGRQHCAQIHGAHCQHSCQCR